MYIHHIAPLFVIYLFRIHYFAITYLYFIYLLFIISQLLFGNFIFTGKKNPPLFRVGEVVCYEDYY